MNERPQMQTEGVEAAIDRAAALIGGASEVALACHVNPDGDALGSMLALHHVLRAAGRRSVASFSEPFVTGPHYRLLPGLDLLVRPDRFPADPDVMVAFDVSSMQRLGDLERPAKAARELIVIDHHLSNQEFGAVNIIEPDAAASAVPVRRLIDKLGMPLNRDAAVCLYAALICDTGRFQYATTTPAVFELARELTAFDIPVADLSRTLFEEHRFAYLRLLSRVIDRAVLDEERRFVWASVTQQDLRDHGVSLEEVEALIDVVRGTREAEVACVLKEAPDGTWRVSLRSLGSVDVRRIAEGEGGGGHRYAAGFTSDESAETVIARIRASL